MNLFTLVLGFLLLIFSATNYAQNNNPVDYWVDLTNANAHVSIGVSDYGRDAQLSVGFVVRLQGTVTGYRQIFHSFSDLTSDANDPLRLGVYILSGTTFGLHLGSSFFNFPLGTTLAANTKYSFVMDLINSGTQVIVRVFLSGTKVIDTTVNGNIAGGRRVTTILGAYRYATGALTNQLTGFIDNFVILTKVSTVAFRDTLKTPLWRPTVDIAPDIRLWLGFDDTISGVGDTTIAVTGSDEGPESIWITAQFYFGAQFKQSTEEGYENCGGWGDPHIYDFIGGRHFDGGESLNGHYLMVGCDEGDIEIRTYTRYVGWWGATVFRAVAFRYKDYAIRYVLDETDDYGGSGALGIPAGAYMKNIASTAWESLPGTANWAYKNGLYYYYTGSGFGVNVPLIAHLSASTGDWRYMDISVQYNYRLTGCPRTGTPSPDGRGYIGSEGFCYEDYIYRRIDFYDWLPPPPYPDINIPVDPCFGLQVAIKTQIENHCRRIYPTNNDLYANCRFDGCSSGDPDIIPFNTPKPECLLVRILNETDSSCNDLICPNFCSYRGTCNQGTKTCVCDAGWVGDDCGQPKFFGCMSFKWGTIETYVSPFHMINTRADTFGGADLLSQFQSLGVERSVLLYTVYFNNMYYLFVVSNNFQSPFSGSYDICFGAAITLSQYVGVTVIPGAPNCYSVSYKAYEQGGIIFTLGAAPTTATFTITVTNKVAVDQVLFGSTSGAREMDIAKVPNNIHASGFTLTVAQCDSEICSIHDGDCKTCSSLPTCGYCLDSNRCMLGTSTGPHRGICRNWRFTFDDKISRVVTVEYGGDDLVNPDYEVFLSSPSTPSALSVSLYVPTGNANNQYDVVLYFQTTSSYPIYASSLKNSLIKTIEKSTYVNMNLNLGIGVYDQIKSTLTQSLTRVSYNNHYLFARALETVAGAAPASIGGQFEALSSIAGINNLDVGYRKYSKKLAVLTVYDIPVDEDKLVETKEILVKKNILPVFLVIGGSTVENYYRNLPNSANGFPNVVIRFDQSGSNFEFAFARMLELGASLPYVSLDFNKDPELIHLDSVKINSSRDILYVSGLTHPSTRARFILPMLRGDGKHHKAVVTVPGYGKAVIVDVDNGIPTGSSYTFQGKEDDPCIVLDLDGVTYKNLLPPIFFITSIPNKGVLYAMDTTKQFAHGQQVSLVNNSYSRSMFCYQAPAHDYSFPVGTVYTTFTYFVTDGCANSQNYTISIIVLPVQKPPLSQDYTISVFEGDNNTAFTIDAFEWDRDLNTNVNEKITFQYSYIIPSNVRPDLFSTIDTTKSLRESNGEPVKFNTDYGPLTTTANKASQNLIYFAPSPDFFGDIPTAFTVSDDVGFSATYKITVSVTPINDPPVAIFEPIIATKEDTPFTVYLQGFDIDNYGLTLTYKLTDLKNNTAVVRNNRTGTPLTLNQEYTYTQANSHKVEVPVTLVPSPDDNNCDPLVYTDYTTCPGFYARLQFKVNDNNNLYRYNRSIATVQSSETGWNTITIHVLAVNDKPITPRNINIYINEDTFNFDLKLAADDIDSLPPVLDNFIEHLPSYKSLHLFQRLTGGVKGNEINSSTSLELNDYSKKRYTQEHGVIVNPDPNVHGTIRPDFFFDSFTYYSWDGKLTSESAIVRVYIKPINDAPIPNPTSLAFKEDNNFTLTFDAADIDNSESELNYTITVLPFFNATIGVTVWFVDGAGVWKQIVASDLPYTVPRVSGRATVVLSPVHNWFGSTQLTYTIKDVDDYLLPSEADYKVNTVTQFLTVVVIPVNDPPVVRLTSPVGSEDTPIIIVLAGDDDAWGEDDTLETVLESDLYDGNGNTKSLGVLYQYTTALYDKLRVNINDVSTGVILQNQSVVTDPQYRVIFVPRQHKNSETRLPHLAMSPWIDYKVREIVSANEPKLLSSTVGSVKIVVESVNDLPVVWGNAWSTIPEYDSVYGIVGGVWKNPPAPASGKQTDVCFDNCFYLEDFGLKYPTPAAPRGIFFGGHDVELTDLMVRIVSVDCPESAELSYIDENGVEKPITPQQLKNWTFAHPITPGSLKSILQFRPGLDDFNVDDPAESRQAQGGHRNSHYCHIVYELIDGDGAVSAQTKDIIITVMQQNDIPREKLNRPKDNSNNNAQIDFNNFFVNQIIGFEDVSVFFKLDAYDVEGDDFHVKIFDCDETRGKFYPPTNNQFNFINANGVLEITTADIGSAFDLEKPIDCVAARTNFVTFSQSFLQTQQKGWYVFFKPGENENGINYNKLSLIYDDGIAPPDKIYGSFRFVTILPVNDAPEISINNPQYTRITYDDNDRIILDPLNFTDTIHVSGSFDIGMVINTPFNFGLNFADDDAFDSPNIDFSIKLVKRPSKDSNEQNEPGSFQNFPNNIPGAVVTRDSITFRGSIEQANKYVATLSFLAEKQGQYDIEIVVKDNGNTGRYCPPGKDFSLGQRECPRTSVAKILVNAYINAALIAGVATGAGVGILLLAGIGAFLGTKFIKPKETKAWDEWDVDNFGDVALSNPFYKGETVQMKNQLFEGTKNN